MLLKTVTDASNSRINASWHLHHSGGTEVLCGAQNPAFTTMLGAAHCPFFDGASRVHKRCPVELRWMFFFLLSFLSHFLEKHT